MVTQRIDQILTFIANKSKSQADYENTRKLLHEILENQRTIVRIDANDIEDTFQTGGNIHGFTVSVIAALDDRMRALIEDARRKAEQFKPYNHVIMFFFMPDTSPLTMDELLLLNEWLEELPDEAFIRWGMALTPSNAPHAHKAIVLLSDSRGRNDDTCVKTIF